MISYMSVAHMKNIQDSNSYKNNMHYHSTAKSNNLPSIKTLEFLKSHSSEYLSGRDLGDVLGISRVSVWKHIKYLKDIGYTIESKQKVGYKLTQTCDEPYPWEVIQNINTHTIGKSIHYYDTVTSTQNIALAMADSQTTHGTVIIAARQTCARGRSKKRWASPYGGIYISVILHPECDTSIATLFPLCIGVAIVKAIKETCNITPQLKWPNDITIRDKKVAGIITEAELELHTIQKMYVGIGVNFDLDTAIIKKEFGHTMGFYDATTILKEKNLQKVTKSKKVSKIELVKNILSHIEQMYDMLRAGQKDVIISEWVKYTSTIGRRVNVTTNGKQITGVATKIDDNGMLIIRQDNAHGLGEHTVLMTGTLRYVDK